jgi:uncharacterized CHY-type Zn-finger protein
MIDYIRKIFGIKNRYVTCFKCETTFREDKLKEVHDGMVYVEAIVCPNCNTADNWEFTSDD